MPHHLLKRGHHLAHGHAAAGAQVDDQIIASLGAGARKGGVKIGQGRDVRLRQVPHVNVIPNAGAVAGFPVHAGDFKGGDAPHFSIDQLAHHMGGFGNVNARAHLGVGANGVEVAQGNAAHGVRRAEILEHHLHHVLGAGIGAAGVERRFFGDHEAGHGIVNGCGGAEDNPLAAQLAQSVEQFHRFAHVLAVVFIGPGGRFGHHNQRGAVDRGINIGMLAEDLLQGGAVGNIGLVEDAPAGELPPPGDERIQDDGGVPAVFEGRGDGAADVSGAASDEEFHEGLLLRVLAWLIKVAGIKPKGYKRAGIGPAPARRAGRGRWTGRWRCAARVRRAAGESAG